jgi:superfamily I DNA/RNA helicase
MGGRWERGSGGEALDPEQRAAAEHVDGALLIVAGPGTGKTRTLTHRLAHLISRRGARPEQCLAVTFSRRAAAEVEERLAALVPAAMGRIVVATFHGLGLMLLKEQAGAAGLSDELRVATPEEQMEIAGGKRPLEEIGRARRLRGLDPDAAILPETAGRVTAYQDALQARGLLDFDDLLLRPLALLGDPDFAASCQERFRWISIDEYQDIDPLQYALIRRLAPAGANVCAIGDPDQSIYGFRGADVGFFLRFREDWPAARVVHLTRNYRSTRTLVEAACQAIRPASLVPERRLVAVRAGGAAERVVVERAASERGEAELVVHTLERLLGGTSSFSFDSGRVRSGDSGDTRAELSFEDVAILYRTEAQTPPLIEALGRAGIPFQKRSHRPLTEQAGVGALLSILRERCLAGQRTASVEALLNEAALGSSANLLAAAELLRPLATRLGDDLEGFLAAAMVGGEVETWDPRAERVSLLTLHASKGLEWPVVFLVGCEDGLLPLRWPGSPEPDTAEERRLFFVGMTRARSRLFLFSSARRAPSPFLADIEAELVENRVERVLRPRGPEQLRLL